jgi:hypothetical protein
MSPRLELEWKQSTLPGCFGWPCEHAHHGGHTVRVWRSNPSTQLGKVGLACWKIDGGGHRVTRGNLGTAKVAASAALRRLMNKERE